MGNAIGSTLSIPGIGFPEARRSGGLVKGRYPPIFYKRFTTIHALQEDCQVKASIFSREIETVIEPGEYTFYRHAIVGQIYAAIGYAIGATDILIFQIAGFGRDSRAVCCYRSVGDFLLVLINTILKQQVICVVRQTFLPDIGTDYVAATIANQFILVCFKIGANAIAKLPELVFVANDKFPPQFLIVPSFMYGASKPM